MADATSINPAYAAIGTIAGAFITALYGTLRLIGEKETKVSEFRQAWVASFRSALTEYVAAVHIIAGRISIREKHHADGQEKNGSYPGWPDLLGISPDTPNKVAGKGSLFDREFESELLVGDVGPHVFMGVEKFCTFSCRPKRSLMARWLYFALLLFEFCDQSR